MGDTKQPKSYPDPTQRTQEQEQAQQEDQVLIKGKFAATDAMERFNDVLGGVFGLGHSGSVFGKTAFDHHRLNAMLDFLDSTNPGDLEDAGDALEKATVALNLAAQELDECVKRTDWEGEAATEFQRYGSEVVSYAWAVGRVSNAVGAQMKVASTGLSSVRNAKPPRDGRLVQKKPEDFHAAEKTQDNPDYQKALQVEKDRQEAINQMNRLASFYAVSTGTLAAQVMPKPPKTYGAEIPRPSGQQRDPVGSGSGAGTARGSLSADSARHVSVSETHSHEAVSRTGGLLDGSDPVRSVGPDRTAPVREPDTKVQIDTVAPPTAPTVTPHTPTPTVPQSNPGPTAPGYPPTVGLGTPPRAGGPWNTGMPGVPRSTGGPTAVGRTGGPASSPAMGRSGGPMGRAGGPSATAQGAQGGRSTPQMGRSGGPMGRSGGPMGKAGGPASSAQGAQAGRSTPQMGRSGGPGAQRPASGGSRGQSPVVGRPGGSGQPATGRTSGAPGSGRSNPIVGGTQQPRAQSGSTGSRIPRGTVVGGESPAAGRTSAGRPSQAGVVGANSGSQTPRPAGRGTPSANGVVGTPRGTGGAGASRGAGSPMGGGRGNQRPTRDEQDREGSSRPDYLTEDEETWANRRRGAVPPVID
ncbi:hypothetical protein ABZ990_28185 [Streptomyces sp. NPDC046203]|uniref:hypothetical protein n=1 Tax=Streptomyces sp. NPDC046203 TaxID=3154602 RepID=UPI0033C542F6